MSRFAITGPTAASRATSVLLVAAVACTAGTEPSTNPRELRSDSGERGVVSGVVFTPGLFRPGEAPVGTGVESDSGQGRHRLWLDAEPAEKSRPLAGVTVELGIVHFPVSDDNAAGNTRTQLVPFVVADVWSEARGTVHSPGAASPPGRFEVIAATTTDAHGAFHFSQAPRGQALLIRVRPSAPYLDTYASAPFWLGNAKARQVNVVVRRHTRRTDSAR